MPSRGYSAEAIIISTQVERIEVDPTTSILLSPMSVKFNNLVVDWKQAVKVKSSYNEITSHPSYLRIIGLGPRVLPLIFNELKREPDYWFAALTALTGENPISPESKGDLKAMTKSWLEWGEQHEYV